MRKGLLIVFTGNGKGKTTAALGTALRAAGHGMKILLLRFIKGAWSSGELDALQRFDSIEVKTLGSGFTWEKDGPDEDRRLARAGWDLAARSIRAGIFDMILLDELNVVLSHKLLPVEEVIETLSARPESLHIIVTGRNAPGELIRIADLVTEMREVKHPYRSLGIRAQKGVEF